MWHESDVSWSPKAPVPQTIWSRPCGIVIVTLRWRDLDFGHYRETAAWSDPIGLPGAPGPDRPAQRVGRRNGCGVSFVLSIGAAAAAHTPVGGTACRSR